MGLAASLGLTALVNIFDTLRSGKLPTTGQLAEAGAEYSKNVSRYSTSLTAFGRQANVMGRVYIEDSIAHDDIAIPLMGILNQMYVCWIITALGLDSVCADGRTVRDRLALVAGESVADDLVKNIKDMFGSDKENKYQASSEAKLIDVDSDTQRLVCGRLIELDFNIGSFTVETKNDTKITSPGRPATDKEGNILGADMTNIRETEQTIGRKGTTNSVAPAQSQAMAASMLKVYMYVQLVPYILQQQVAAGFMGVNFAPSVATRWKQLRVGEISFVKDFIFARDLIKKQASLLKKDNTGIVAEMMARQRNSLFRWVTGLTGILPERHNLANAIIILNKQTFDQTCRDAHIDFNNRVTREQFFLKTFSMVVVVVDPMYGTAQMYFAGLPAVGTYSYAMLNKVGARNKDSFDLKEVMTAFAQGQTPRF